MAENKNSFILYADLIHTVRKLPKDIAGDLFLTILEFVNDENPDPENMITQIAFEPIKQQLKRDLRAWEGTKDSKSDAGKLGNLKRWHSDLHKQVIDNEISIEEALTIAHNRRTSHTDSTQSHPIANIAVNVNDTVNVNDNIHIKGNSENNQKPKKDIPEYQEFLEYFKSLSEVYKPELEFSLKSKYESWVENNWKDGNGKKISNWKIKLKNTIPYLRAIQSKPQDKEIKYGTIG